LSAWAIIILEVVRRCAASLRLAIVHPPATSLPPSTVAMDGRRVGEKIDILSTEIDRGF
jgi:hypothetical protein